jgi:hypothetical protein
MKSRIAWTTELDAELRRRRGLRETWQVICAGMGLGRNSIIERCRKIGARKGVATAAGPVDDKDRPALAAGHPASWALINAGLATKMEAFDPTPPNALLPECRWDEDAERVAKLAPSALRVAGFVPPRFTCTAPRLPDRAYCLCHSRIAYPGVDFSRFKGGPFDVVARPVPAPALMAA